MKAQYAQSPDEVAACLADPQLAYVHEHAMWAVWHVYAEKGLDPSLPDFADDVQEAIISFYNAYKATGYHTYAYIAARNRTKQTFARRKSVHAVSLESDDPDAPPWDETIAAPPIPDEEWTDDAWISDADLEATVEKALTAKTKPNYYPARRTIKDHAQLLRLLMQGHGTESISLLMGVSPSAVKHRRHEVRRILANLCEVRGITPPELDIKPGGNNLLHWYGKHENAATRAKKRGEAN